MTLAIATWQSQDMDKPKPTPSCNFEYNIKRIEKMIDNQVLDYCDAKKIVVIFWI